VAILNLLAMLAVLALLALYCYSLFMATIVIRNLDEAIKRRLQVRAALNGRSMEAEARAALTLVAEKVPDASAISQLDGGLGTAIHKLFAPLGGVELLLPPRHKSHRKIPKF
jgi:plasmid stability protein